MEEIDIMGFINYPKITYNNVDVSNILFNINIIDKENTPELFLQYYVKDEDTPESVSYKIYEDPTYSWLILSLNNMYNKEYDWPMSSNKFETFLENKYTHTSLYFSELDINFSFGDITKIKSGTINYYIKSYDRTLNVINLTELVSSTAINTTNNIILYSGDTIIKTLKPKRVVYEGKQSLHHFENNGKYVNARSRINNYLNGNEDYVVTNFDYEYSLNESKRYLKILDPRLLQRYDSEFKKILKQVENNKERIENE
jgi:hypothetical protein